MKKSVFYLLLLLNVFILSCRSEESVPEQTEFVAPITAFKNFDEKIASDISYKARHLQNIESAKKMLKPIIVKPHNLLLQQSTFLFLM